MDTETSSLQRTRTHSEVQTQIWDIKSHADASPRVAVALQQLLDISREQQRHIERLQRTIDRLTATLEKDHEPHQLDT